MSLKCTITKVVLIKQLPVFILAQLSSKGRSQQKSQNNKFRTQLSLNTTRPKFHNNQFFFTLSQNDKRTNTNDNQTYSLKFGLMLMPCDSYGKIISQDYQQAKPVSVASLNLSVQRLREMGSKPQVKYFDMVDSRGKVYAQFEFILQYFDNLPRGTRNQRQSSSQNKQQSNQHQLPSQKTLLNPLINWMMHDQNCQDPLRQQNCIRSLQQQSNILYKKFNDSKYQEQKLQSLLSQLQSDEKQLLSQLQIYEKLNNKISQKLNQKQSLDSLELQIDMLKGSKEGKQLLLDKVQYFQDRIFKQEQIYQQLILRYEKMKPEIERKLKQSEGVADKLKGKQQQEFQMRNNQQILNNYEQILYEYRSGQQVINQLIKLSRSPRTTEYSRQQAQLFISQVKHQLKLQQLNIQTNNPPHRLKPQTDHQQNILSMIEQEMKDTMIAKEQLTNCKDGQNVEEQQFVMKVKLESLSEEIQRIKGRVEKVKIRKYCPVKGGEGKSGQSSMFVYNKSLLSTG